jgi:hypothetical protein
MVHRILPLLAAALVLLPAAPRADGPASRSATCSDHKPSATRWLASFRDRVPLAVSDRGAIREAGQGCCAPWSRVGGRWRSVDAWGQVVGEAVVKRRSYYDFARCYDLDLQVRRGRAGVLYASATGSWRPPASAAWAPSAAERAALHRFVADLDRLIVSGEAAATVQPLAGRLLTFRVLARKLTALPPPPNPTRFAVIGGRYLAIATLASNGRWVLGHLEHGLTDDRRQIVHRPVAVFDLDGDGLPEVIHHFSEGEFFGDDVLRLDPRFDRWERVARSVMGSTA